jgi:hypothetical protein
VTSGTRPADPSAKTQDSRIKHYTINDRGEIMLKSIAPAVLALAFACTAQADLTVWKDYTLSDSVWQVTTVKVKANMQDAYLEGIKKTWVASNEIEDYKVYASDLPQSGDFNLLLVVKFKNNEMLAPNQARYDAFMAKWGADRDKQTTEMAQRDYPGMRELTGEYALREVTFK